MDLLDRTLRSIVVPDARAARLSRIHQLTVARPIDSLGALDAAVHHIAAIRGTTRSGPLPAVISVLAGDHGVARRNISAFDPGVTSSVLALIQAGHAPVNIMGHRAGAPVEAADFGLVRAVGDGRFRLAAGTADICETDAMSRASARGAVENGIRWAQERLMHADLVAVGEIGVGNTTATAAVVAHLLGLTADQVVGPGSGVDQSVVRRKRSLVAQSLSRTIAGPDDAEGTLSRLGGYEIAGNVGVILAVAAARKVVVLDGYITGAAALLAVRMCPAVRNFLLASHRSAEPGHAAVLEELDLRPLLDLNMRLGMASGAALALPLLNTALDVAANTLPAKFATLGSRR